MHLHLEDIDISIEQSYINMIALDLGLYVSGTIFETHSIVGFALRAVSHQKIPIVLLLSFTECDDKSFSCENG